MKNQRISCKYTINRLYKKVEIIQIDQVNTLLRDLHIDLVEGCETDQMSPALHDSKLKQDIKSDLCNSTETHESVTEFDNAIKT